MRGYARKQWRRWAGVGALLATIGCAGTPPSRFYVLSTTTPSPQGAASPEFDVRIASVTIPSYLDRPQFVTRTGTNELRLAELDRWAERLDRNIERVLGEELRLALGARFPTSAAAAGLGKVVLGVDVARFECGADEVCALEAHFRVRLDRESEPGLEIADHADIATEASAPTFAARAAAMSEDVAELARRIAAATAEAVNEAARG